MPNPNDQTRLTPAGSDLHATLVRSADEQPRLAGGVSVPGFAIERTLGRGGMGVVYLATQTGLNRPVALKMLLAGPFADPALRARFLLEAESVAALEQPHIVRVFAFGEAGGHPYLAMEFAPGGTLADRLKRVGLLPAREAAELLAKLADAVAHAHSRGVVHRDIKPHNVLLAADSEPRLADFGLAKVGRADQHLTATGVAIGTPPYMSPEQAAGKVAEIGTATDVYALGAVLYDLLTGRPPFTGDSATATLQKVLSEEPDRPRKLNATIPCDLETICLKCLEKDAAKRYPTAQALADELRRYLRHEPITARPLGTVSRAVRWARRNPVVAGLLTTIAIVSFGLVGSLYSQYRQAVAQAAIEREKTEQAERAQQQAEIAWQNAERAEAAERTAARNATDAATQAAEVATLTDTLNDLFRSSDPLAAVFGDAVSAVGVPGFTAPETAVLAPFLRKALNRVRAAPAGPATAPGRARMLDGIGKALKSLGLFAEARPVLAEALALRRTHLPETHPDVIQSELDFGRLESEGGDTFAGIDRFRRVYALQQKAGADPAVALTTRFFEGITLCSVGMPEAEGVLAEVVRGREKLFGRAHRDTLLAKLGLMAWFLEKQDPVAVTKLFAEIKADVTALPDARTRAILGPILNTQAQIALANGLKRLGPLAMRGPVAGIRADLVRLATVIPDDHILMCIFRFELAKLELASGNVGAADALFARVLMDMKKTIGLAHPKIIWFLSSYVPRLVAAGRIGEARALFDEVEVANRSRFGGDNEWLTVVLLMRAEFEADQGQYERALAAQREAVGLAKRGRFLATSWGLIQFFDAAKSLGRVTEPKSRAAAEAAAREMFVALRSLVARVYGPASAEMVILRTSEGCHLYERGDRAGAAACFADAHSLLPGTPRLDPTEANRLYNWYGALELDRGAFVAAERHYRAALALAVRMPELTVADREAVATQMAGALVGQGRYLEAVPFFEHARRLKAGMNPTPKDLAMAYLRVAACQRAAGDFSGHAKTVDEMFRQFGASEDVNTLARLAWAAGLRTDPDPRLTGLATRFAAAFDPKQPFAWGYRGLALVRLRLGQFDAALMALGQAGKSPRAVDHAIRGLVAAGRGDRGAAREFLAKAEALETPPTATAANPFPFADNAWHQHLEAVALVAGLRAAIAVPVAPPPRLKPRSR